MTPREALLEIIPLLKESHPEAILALDKAVFASETMDGKRFMYEWEKQAESTEHWRRLYHMEILARQLEHTRDQARIRDLEAEAIALKAEMDTRALQEDLERTQNR